MPFLPRAARRDLRINPTLAWIQPPASQGRIPGYQIGEEQSAGVGTTVGVTLQRGLIAKCKRRDLRTYSKMKELMALAAGLPTIFRDRQEVPEGSPS